MTDEDIAHIAVRLQYEKVQELLDNFMCSNGYQRIPLGAREHLSKEVNWDSPFDPPPQYRCFMVIKEVDGWTTLCDELDRLDRRIPRDLSRAAPVISVTGYYQLDEFEYWVWDNGSPVGVDEADSAIVDVLEAIRLNPDHVTKFPYDEIATRLEHETQKGNILFVGYMLKI